MNSQTQPKRVSFLQVASQNLEMLKRLQSAPPRLVVIGNFNAGKSTLINTFVGKRLLPTALKPTTGTVIRVIWGAQEQTTLHFLDGRMKTAPGTALLEEYAVIGAPGNTELLEDIQVETPAPFLEGNLTIVDVPGMEDDPERYEPIFREILRADLVLSVHDVQRQMPMSEIALLDKEMIAAGCDSISLLFNKCNLLQAGEAEQALVGMVSRVKGMKLRPLEPMRSWYRLDVQPELRRMLAGEGHSVEFRTFLEDIGQALRAGTDVLRERRSRKMMELQVALQQNAEQAPVSSGQRHAAPSQNKALPT